MTRLVTARSVDRVNVMVVEKSASCSTTVENEYPLLVDNPAVYSAVAGSKSSGISTSVSGSPRSMSSMSSISSLWSPSWLSSPPGPLLAGTHM